MCMLEYPREENPTSYVLLNNRNGRLQIFSFSSVASALAESDAPNVQAVF